MTPDFQLLGGIGVFRELKEIPPSASTVEGKKLACFQLELQTPARIYSEDT